jgi:hypothetical protein
MKLNRYRITTIPMVVLAIFIGVLLCSCATTGDGKVAEPDTESPDQTENQSAAVEEASGTNPETLENPVVNTAGSGDTPPVSKASPKNGEDGIRHSAAYLLQALERILPGPLPDLNWNRFTTVVVGLLIIAMIYGLAFALGRLPARRRGVASRGGGG